jgi:deazaflavin-dependent oxidoreductase (nitroreductase family)
MNDGHRRDEPYRALPPPRGVLKKVLSLPVVLERHGLGRILGNRFIIIEHVGRSSGRVYRTPVEVVAHDSDGEQSWTVVAAWDAHPDWLANIEHRDARAVIVAGRRHEHPTQQRLDPVTASDGVRQQFTTLFDYGVFDKFPRLKVVVLESGGGWIGYWLDRIDAVYGHTFIGTRVPLKDKPSDYFRERVWISCDPDERTIPALAARFGADRFMWASDFPHADHTPDYVTDLDALAGAFDPAARRQFLGDNARELYGIGKT